MESLTNKIASWDGEDCTTLLPVLREVFARYQKMREAMEDGGAFKDEIMVALSNVEERCAWPAPWDQQACPFALVADRQGQYLNIDWHETLNFNYFPILGSFEPGLPG